MNLYRARPLEVQAINLGDGRYVLLDEPPRYVASVEFEAAFELVGEDRRVVELVEEHRVVERRTKPGKRPKGKERRAASRRVGSEPSANGDGKEPKAVTGARARGRELWDQGKDPSAIAKAVKKNVSNVYYWKKVDHWPDRDEPAAASPSLEAAIAARTEASSARPPRREQVDQAIAAVRGQVDSEIAGRRDRGREPCPKCHMLNSSYARECGSCGHKFPPRAPAQ